MALDFSTLDYTATITLSDYTGQTVSVRYNLTATTMAGADMAVQTIANRLKAISAHRVETVTIKATFSDVDADTPTADVETVGYLVGNTDTVDQEMFQLEIPGYSGPATGNEIDLLNTLVNDYAVLFESGGTVYVFGGTVSLEFCRGWILDRGKQPR